MKRSGLMAKLMPWKNSVNILVPNLVISSLEFVKSVCRESDRVFLHSKSDWIILFRIGKMFELGCL